MSVLQQARVLDRQRPGPGFARVVLGVDDVPGGFTARGFDQWFRLFLPSAGRRDGLLHLPQAGADGSSDGWWSAWKAMDPRTRPVVRNYTARSVRRAARGDSWEVDVDFALHRDGSGQVDGVASRWALDARPGDVAAVLDQGTLVDDDCAADGPVLVVGDETGLPAAEGIAASLPAGTSARVVVEVTDGRDVRDIASAADLDVEFLVRRPGVRAGDVVLPAFTDRAASLRPDTYVLAVGETSAVGRVKKAARAAGIARVRGCPYWNAGRDRADSDR